MKRRNFKWIYKFGDKVTYKIREIVYTEIINNLSFGARLKNDSTYEILKIERPKYEVVEEKKELLTEEEKEFLKDICKYYDVTEIRLNNIEIKIINNGHLVSCFNYPYNMKFENLERGKTYKLEELGLEEN